MWINGPYACEYCNDINIFRELLVSFLGPGERVETDDGYIGDAPHHIKWPMSCTNPVDTGRGVDKRPLIGGSSVGGY